MPKETLVRCIAAAALVAIALGGLYFGYRGLVGWPATPMTVSQADRLFAQGVQPGQTVEEVEAWLVSQGILRESGDVSYHVARWREDVTFRGSWMDGRGGETVAECAGLSVDDVYTVIRVRYPEADRYVLGVTEISVYLFFDDQGRLIRHWVAESHLMP
jgi:hypothetical protein